VREHVGYQWALAGFEIVTIAVLIVTLLLGKNARAQLPSACCGGLGMKDNIRCRTCF